jgi:hypothetical protein
MFGFDYPVERINDLQYSMTFSAQRSIEENMAEFRQIVEACGIPFWDKFSNKDTLYSCLFIDEYAFAFKDWSEYSFPISCFMNKDYKQSLLYAKQFLEQHKQEVRSNPKEDGLAALLERYKVFYKNLKKMIESQPDYQQKDPFTKLNEIMKKIITIALIISACISLHAQQPKRVVKFVFQTDKSGSIVKRIPVFEEEKEKKDLKIQQRLSVKPQNGGVKVLSRCQTSTNINTVKSLSIIPKGTGLPDTPSIKSTQNSLSINSQQGSISYHFKQMTNPLRL